MHGQQNQSEQTSLQALANFPSLQILYAATEITQLPMPLRVAENNAVQISLNNAHAIAIKRDDLTPGFGNKTRKLETILADALASGADCLITAGGPQSNHCRQTAQFGRELDLEVHLMFGTASGEQDFECAGNQVIDRLFSATVHTCKKSERSQAMEALAQQLKEQGKNPYIVPVGGSNYLGTIAYAKGFQEFLQQCQQQDIHFERIVFASSSGGTQAGLVVGAKLARWSGDIIGISIDQVPDNDEPDPNLKYVKHMVDISNEALEKLNSIQRVTTDDFRLHYGYLQDGYGIVGDYDRIGVMTLANHGILAGPVYSGRAFGAYIDLLAKGELPDDGKTLFWHTGGAGEIDVYRQELFKHK